MCRSVRIKNLNFKTTEGLSKNLIKDEKQDGLDYLCDCGGRVWIGAQRVGARNIISSDL